MMDYGGRVARADTFPKLLRLNAHEHGGDVALREKDLGLWREFTWNEYQVRVRDFTLGLVEFGLGASDVIAIIGDNGPDWAAVEIAAHAIASAAALTARTMRRWLPHRQRLRFRADLIWSSVGAGVEASNAAASMIIPLRQ